MNKLVSSLAAAVVVVFVGGGAAGASTPAADPVLALSPSTVEAGAAFQAILTGCSAGEAVNFVIEDTDLDPATATCAGQSASALFLAPTLGGPYTITATGSTSGAAASAPLIVTGGEEAPQVDIPTTGSPSIPIALVAAGLVVAGASLALLASVRRSRTPTV